MSVVTMRQAVEAQVLNPYCELGEEGLRQILTDVIEEVKQSLNQDIDGAEILHSLLNASWLQSLLKVYECLEKFLRDTPAPLLDCASGLSFQLLIDIRARPGCSEEARELYRLLRQPHLQALLSAHDTVAQRDFEPVLPPMPDDLPDDEEATRIVCLVKNKQPLFCSYQRVELPLPSASTHCAKNPMRRFQSHWETVRHLNRQRPHRGGVFTVQSLAAQNQSSEVNDLSWWGVRRGNFPPDDLPCHTARPWPSRPLHYKPTSTRGLCCRKPISQCRVCYTHLLWEQSLPRLTPSVYSSVLMDNVAEEQDRGNEDETEECVSASQRWTRSRPHLSEPYYSSIRDYLQSTRLQSPRIRTAPPSPMRPHCVTGMPPVELAKQESLDELRTTVQMAASSMESSTKDIKLLGEKMAVATEQMSETVQDNSQALVLLAEAVERLQILLTNTRTNINSPNPAVCEENSSPRYNTTTQEERLSLTHQAKCSFPSLLSSTSSSSSLSSYLDAPSTSLDISCLSVSCHGSPRPRVETRNTASPRKKTSRHTLTNGLDEPKQNGGYLKPRKKKKEEEKEEKEKEEEGMKDAEEYLFGSLKASLQIG
uniref:uncharacterized protein mpp4b isoform X2 n=1 Tax=Solea senegalensis TaxID=28829 RepID=UPI001CD830AD|nr:uncharacterized protein mpp4b isoform X2 [Solea senegalensis]